MRTKRIGVPYRFTYPNYGTPETHPDYRAHSNQIVTILRQLSNRECDPECQPMWRIVARDGWVGSAHSSELRAAKLPKLPKQKMLFIVCRFWLKSKKQPVQEFFTVHTTFNRATYQCDKLTNKFGPTFIIVEAPLDP